jgi:hypothetical protein
MVDGTELPDDSGMAGGDLVNGRDQGVQPDPEEEEDDGTYC